ncbi:hypothetical protein [Burkholderia cenocepacia]|uniref:hypothetical protein n=2 Tax=Burkholderia cenocepacia TaxID=95486 RepID=UPI0015619597|nr:hypothetical protein [Burkholderia cenocepacia]MCW3535528.1 hypothetical protein [Burkholderia cenocepacia]MCW3573221.1 hypothetical protein [Burkholderia cenocepacia]MCW5162632.1 hypothetical protein [Burkholderia cenocepacia]
MFIESTSSLVFVWNRLARDTPPAAWPGAASDEAELHHQKTAGEMDERLARCRRASGGAHPAGVGASASPRTEIVSAAVR